MTIGSNIRCWRRGHGWPQEYLAEQLGVSKMLVSKWENDICTPKTADLVALADLLGCRCDDLLPGRYRVIVEADDIEPSRKARIEALFSRHVEALQQLGVEFDRIVIERDS